MGEVLTTLMRWLHLSSVATLIGGLIYARFVIGPSESFLPPDAHATLDEAAAAHFRPVAFTAITCLVISGLFNFLTHPGHSPLYHALFGTKILLALHIFAVAIMVSQPGNQKRNRQMFGAVVSGLLVILISNYLKGIN